jgi:hypothetical protein
MSGTVTEGLQKYIHISSSLLFRIDFIGHGDWICQVATLWRKKYTDRNRAYLKLNLNKRPFCQEWTYVPPIRAKQDTKAKFTPPNHKSYLGAPNGEDGRQYLKIIPNNITFTGCPI